ncbi:ribosome recycling factor [Metamycoplasma subdolum]|uniref:Ribosome recycling factor n=1 Tax=Metamycoplasma subdolum TaxID=92407 RepID=A0A3M0A7U2_9BACT|nr:ribosome-recycling factor [Metamycoplasma subdolum]RMA78545.1 ribosome recycling factor [Metamycoplasma subdolum]WPB50477.1 ribosome-recycling factor [Metamycoplasma subdolum]
MDLDLYILELNEATNKTLENYENQLTKVVVGRANPNLVNKIKIEYYDSFVNLEEIASIQIASALQLIVKPYDVAVIKDIEKAIMNYKLNVTIANEGHQLRLTYPMMTTEKRKEMVKQLSVITEQAKVGIRQARQDVNKKIKSDENLSEDLQKQYLDIIQKHIDETIEKILKIQEVKEKDLMTI